MIPEEVENRVTKYFFHNYLPDEIMMEVVDKLLPSCIYTEKENLDFNELVRWAIEIIKEQLEDKRLKKIVGHWNMPFQWPIILSFKNQAALSSAILYQETNSRKEEMDKLLR